MSLFFPPSQIPLFSLSLSVRLIVEFWWCFLKARALPKYTFGLSGPSCATLVGPSRLGRRNSHTITQRTPHVRFGGHPHSKHGKTVRKICAITFKTPSSSLRTSGPHPSWPSLFLGPSDWWAHKGPVGPAGLQQTRVGKPWTTSRTNKHRQDRGKAASQSQAIEFSKHEKAEDDVPAVSRSGSQEANHCGTWLKCQSGLRGHKRCFVRHTPKTTTATDTLWRWEV